MAGIAFGPDGTLYGAGERLSRVNMVTGATTFIGQLPELLSSIAFDNTGGLWGIGNGTHTLWKINPQTGQSFGGHFLSNLGAGGIQEITFDRNGTLFGIGQGVLYTINPSTARVVTAVELSISFNQGLAFGSDSALYSLQVTTGPSTLYSLNRTTGFATAIGPSSVAPPAIVLGSLAAPVTGAPEPAPAVLLMIGVAALGAKLRRRICVRKVGVWPIG